MTAVTEPGVRTRPLGAASDNWSATDTSADASTITLPVDDVNERSLLVPSIATVPVTRTLPRSDETVPEPFLRRRSSISNPAEPASVVEPWPLMVTASTVRMPPAVTETLPASVVAEVTTKSLEAVTEMPVPAVATIELALELSEIAPFAVTVMLSATRRAWLVISVAELIEINCPEAETTAADSTETAPFRLVTCTLPTPDLPAVMYPPSVTVSPASWMLPASVVRGLLTIRSLASSDNPA